MSWLLLLLACADTIPVDEPLAIAGDVHCEADPEHPLRARCSASTGPLRVELLGPAGQLHQLQTEAESGILWGLRPEADYLWVGESGRGGGSGSLRTGSAPAGLIDLEVEGELSADGLLLASCDQPGTLLIVDGEGRIRWYADAGAELGGAGVHALRWTDEQTALAVVGRHHVVEVDPRGGRTVLDLSSRDGLLHHDIARQAERTYALYATERDGRVVDGVWVLDAQGELLGNLDTRDLFDPERVEPEVDRYWAAAFPGATGLAHANAVDVDASGVLLISLRNLDALVAVEGDPASPDFGHLRWSVEGVDGPALQATHVLRAAAGVEPGFDRPHHLRHVGAGELSLFDNRDPYVGQSRGLGLRWESEELWIDDEWPMGLTCPVLSSLHLTESGAAWLTCSSEDVLEERDAAGGTRWRAEVRCPEPGIDIDPMIARAIPVAIP